MFCEKKKKCLHDRLTVLGHYTAGDKLVWQMGNKSLCAVLCKRRAYIMQRVSPQPCCSMRSSSHLISRAHESAFNTNDTRMLITVNGKKCGKEKKKNNDDDKKTEKG